MSLMSETVGFINISRYVGPKRSPVKFRLYRTRDRIFSAKLVPTFADRGCT
jgi:hypothetical protein